MAVIVQLSEVQQWLEGTKLTLGALDADLTDTAQVQVLSALQAIFDTSLWIGPTETPALVRKIISLYIAGWTYARQYSEATAENKNVYASWLCQRADVLLAGLVAGTLTLAEDPDAGASNEPSFWPNDTTGSSQQYDGAGEAIGGQYDQDIKFSMGKVF
jgi:hypothetical protein